MGVDRGRRRETDRVADLAHRRWIAPRRQLAVDEVQYLPALAREHLFLGHGATVATVSTEGKHLFEKSLDGDQSTNVRSSLSQVLVIVGA